MKTFLLPVDFSEGTFAACKHAVHLAGQDQTTLFLFHIYPDQFIVSDSSIPVGIDSDAFFNAGFIESLREQAEQNMKKLKAEIRKFADSQNASQIEIDHLVTGGDLEWEIRAICKEINPALIVMSTEGEGGKGILEGSMAEKIMSKAKIPVVAVPRNFKKNKTQHIMYPTNFSDNDIETINRVFDIFKGRGIVIHVVHFLFDDKNAQCQSSLDFLSDTFGKQRLEGKIKFNLISGSDKFGVLATFSEKYNIDMIAFLSHKKNFFQHLFSQKISKKDFIRLELPLLALHE